MSVIARLFGEPAASSATWHNWGRTEQCQPSKIHQPGSLEKISAVINTAREAGSTVRPLGAGHSFTPVAATDGHRIQLDNYAGLVHLDEEAKTVTLRAGTRLRDIPGLLRPLGWALANQGDVDPQALAGAVSTGTHGTGLNFTGFAGMVRSFKIVGSDGVEHFCSPGADEHGRELYRLARVGLGLFGVLTEITLDAVPAFDLHADEHREDFTAMRTSFVERCKETDHLEFYWFPNTEYALVKENTRVPAAKRHDVKATWKHKLDEFGTFIDEEIINNGGLLAVCELAKAKPNLTPALNNFAAKAVAQRTYTDEAHRVFVSPRRVKFAEMEYAVPLESVSEVLADLKRTIESSNLKISFPVEVRSASKDDVALSTAYGRDSAYIAVHRYWKEDHREYFRLVEPIFKATGGRPHWGKIHTLSNDDLRERYPLFDEVAALRSKVDPDGMFLTPYLRNLFVG